MVLLNELEENNAPPEWAAFRCHPGHPKQRQASANQVPLAGSAGLWLGLLVTPSPCSPRGIAGSRGRHGGQGKVRGYLRRASPKVEASSSHGHFRMESCFQHMAGEAKKGKGMRVEGKQNRSQEKGRKRRPVLASAQKVQKVLSRPTSFSSSIPCKYDTGLSF